MLGELEATRMWRKIFKGQAISDRTLAEAQALVEELPPESPLRSRFSAEINELRIMNPLTKPKKKRGARAPKGD